MNRQRHLVEVRGLPIAVHTWEGPETKTPLLLLHGFLDHARSFEAVASALGGERRLVAPDFRGHGESGWVGSGGYYHYADYFGDVLAVLEAERLDKFSVLAHSMGAGVAAALAALLPGRLERVVLLEGLGPPPEEADDGPAKVERWFRAVRKPELDQDVEGRRRARSPMRDAGEAADRLMRINPRLSRALASSLADSATEEVEGGRVWRFDPLHRTPSPRPYLVAEARAFWRRIEAPVLALSGSDSEWRVDDTAARAAAIPRIRTALVRGAGHNVHHDQPDLVAAAVRFWLEHPDPMNAALPDGLT